LKSTRAVLSVIAAAVLVAAAGCASMQSWFAPSFRLEGPHAEAKKMGKADCFGCHRAGKDGAPKAPQSMYGKDECLSCHLSE